MKTQAFTRAVWIGVVAMMMAGCSAARLPVKEVPPPGSVSRLTDSKTLMLHEYGIDEEDLLTAIKVAASNGKKQGYEYFAVVFPPSINNIMGSPISTPEEYMSLCGSDMSNNCPYLRYPSTSRDRQAIRLATVYFNEPPVDFVVWDVDKTLNSDLLLEIKTDQELQTDYEYWNYYAGDETDFEGYMK